MIWIWAVCMSGIRVDPLGIGIGNKLYLVCLQVFFYLNSTLYQYYHLIVQFNRCKKVRLEYNLTLKKKKIDPNY